MSNEDMIEEILVESYRLGISERVFEKFTKYIINNERSTAYKLAFDEVINEDKKTNNNEIF